MNLTPLGFIYLFTFAWLLGPLQGQSQTLLETDYMSVMLPPGWDCQREQTDIVCQPMEPLQSRQAIIVITAKQASFEEDLDFLKRRLLEPRASQVRPSQQLRSEITAQTTLQLGGLEWVDATHFASELPQFNTRYVATSSHGLSVLFSFSAHSSQWDDYNLHFQSILSSLRLPPLEVWSDLAVADIHSRDTPLGVSGLNTTQLNTPGESRFSLPWLVLGLILLAIAFAVYILKKP